MQRIAQMSRLMHTLKVSIFPRPIGGQFSTTFPTQQQQSTRPERVLTGYRFAKADACLEVSVRHAKFRAVGAQGIYHSLSQEGTVRLTLFRAKAAMPQGSAGNASGQPGAPVSYDYREKMYVDVTALDIVNIVQSPIAQPVREARARSARCGVRAKRASSAKRVA